MDPGGGLGRRRGRRSSRDALRRERIAWAAVAIAAAGLAGLSVSLWRDATREPPRTIQSTLLPPAKATFSLRRRRSGFSRRPPYRIRREG